MSARAIPCSLAVASLVTLALAAQDRGGDPKPKSDEDLAATYFQTADYDGDGSITFGESEKSLRIDRRAFRVFDTDNDGLISSEEFARRYRAVVARGGAFAPPIAKPDPRKIHKRTPDELLATFDRDKDLALDESEVQRALEEYGARGVDARVILQTLDRDRTQRLEKPEMQDLLEVLVPPTAEREKKKIGSIAELFDKTEPRDVKQDSTREPHLVIGPVSTFRRLDFDASGGISLQDLNDLQRPLQIPVRASAVIATLDVDGDGVVSPTEFQAALR